MIQTIDESRADALTITENERDGNWYEFAVNGHGGMIRVVARMEDDECDYPLGKRVRDFLLAAPPVEQHEAAPADFAHLANEWADAACNGVQWLKNIRDGFSTADEALAEMQTNVERIRGLGDLHRPAPSAPIEGTDNGAVIDEVRAELEAIKGGTRRSESTGWSGTVGACDRALTALSRAPRTEVAGAVPQPIGPHDVTTSAGGRGYIAEFFAKRLCRHDFGRYIDERLAADFACALAKYLMEHDTSSSAHAAAAPADELQTIPKWIFDNMVETLAPAWNYIQANPDQFDALPGDDKNKILVDEFLCHATRHGLTDEQILDAFSAAGIDLNATTNMAYTVRGSQAQLVEAARALLDHDGA